MVYVNKRTNKVQLTVGLIPIALSMIFLINSSLVLLLLCALSLFIIIGAVPLFRKRENLYMFVIVGVTGLPINIRLSYWLVSEDFIGLDFLIGDILWGLLLCCVFFSVEEIVFGVVTRMIWKRQYKINV